MYKLRLPETVLFFEAYLLFDVPEGTINQLTLKQSDSVASEPQDALSPGMSEIGHYVRLFHRIYRADNTLEIVQFIRLTKERKPPVYHLLMTVTEETACSKIQVGHGTCIRGKDNDGFFVLFKKLAEGFPYLMQ